MRVRGVGKVARGKGAGSSGGFFAALDLCK